MGNYTFGNLPNGTYTVTPSKSGFSFTPGSATVTITNASLTGVNFTASSVVSSVLINPIRAVVTFGTTQQFTSNTAVTWTVDGVTGGNSSVGTVSTSGLYTPPPAVGQHTVTAVSKADASQTASGTVWVSNSGPILTHKYNNYRAGQNTSETVLTPANVNPSTFGKLFSYPVDGYNYAEPLYVPNLNIAGGTHNVVFVATEHDSVYAFDADGKQSTPLWQVSFINPSAGILPFSSSATAYIGPEIGITSTPAIDLSTGTMYVVADTQVNGTGARYQLHALDITTGAEKFGGPVTISGSVSGTGAASRGGTVTFDPAQHLQRASLLLANGAIYIAFASFGDTDPYHGWIFTYSASTLARLGIFCDTPNGTEGGIWMAGAGMSADSSGNVYVSTGNGTFTVQTAGSDYGDSVIKFSSSPSLTVTDWFSPYDNSSLSVLDLDLGSGGLLLFPDGTGGGSLMLIGGKNGTLYLLNRASLGHWQSGSNSQIIQSIQNASPGEIFGTPVWWNGWVYVGALNDSIKAFQLQNGKLTTIPTSATSTYFPDPGAPAPSLSANGSSNGILWALEYTGGTSEVLHAWDATDLSRELYNSSSNLGDDLGPGVRFTVPTVADGKVFVGTAASLAVYGPANR
ncbi:MAG: pyrrolo-quinoline quinone [Acidobacteriia bacterium]|nr:pyrrolo-quinoline quinone [Terriglobia bacterium]